MNSGYCWRLCGRTARKVELYDDKMVRWIDNFENNIRYMVIIWTIKTKLEVGMYQILLLLNIGSKSSNGWMDLEISNNSGHGVFTEK